ncbi:hypothetical protein IC575_005494 [Cucumis melo]
MNRIFYSRSHSMNLTSYPISHNKGKTSYRISHTKDKASHHQGYKVSLSQNITLGINTQRM